MGQHTKPCAHCGGAEFAAGHLVWNAPVRFKTEGQGSFRRGTPVEARACKACGHVTLFVQELPD